MPVSRSSWQCRKTCQITQRTVASAGIIALPLLPAQMQHPFVLADVPAVFARRLALSTSRSAAAGSRCRASRKRARSLLSTSGSISRSAPVARKQTETTTRRKPPRSVSSLRPAAATMLAPPGQHARAGGDQVLESRREAVYTIRMATITRTRPNRRPRRLRAKPKPPLTVAQILATKERGLP